MATQELSRDEMFNSFTKNLQLVVDNLAGNEHSRGENEDFRLPEFWNEVETMFKAMSFEVTKLALSFRSLPPPSIVECQSQLGSVEMKTIALVSLYYGLPKHCGTTLRKHTRNMVTDIVEGIRELAIRIKSACYKSTVEQLQSTGAVWASCDIIQTAAKNNKDAALKELKSAAGLIKDAVEELEEAKNTDGSSFGGLGELELLSSRIQPPTDSAEDVWSEQDKAVIHPCLGLANACKACIKKVTEAIKNNGKYEEIQHIEELDQVVQLSDEISPNLDELVSCLYAPMRYIVVRANASLIVEVLHKLLDFVKDSHFVTAADSQWLEFLTKAIDHNIDQVKNITKEETPR